MFNINGGIHLAEIGPPSVLGVLGALADAFAMVYYVIVLILAFWVLALAFPLAVAMFLPSLVWAPVLPVCKHVFDIVLNVLWVSLTAATVCIGLFQLGKFANSTMTTTTPLGASMAFFAAFWLCKKYIVSFSKTSYRYIQNKSNQWGEFTLGTSAPDWRMYSKVNESGLNQSYANYARPQRSTAADDAADATPGYKPASKKSQLGNYMISRAVESAAIKYGAMAGPWGFIAGSALTVATHHFRNKAEIPTFGDYRTW
jgi:hypothetical protein